MVTLHINVNFGIAIAKSVDEWYGEFVDAVSSIRNFGYYNLFLCLDVAKLSFILNLW